MDVLYQQIYCRLRAPLPHDWALLAQELRPADRAELAASHPGQDPQELLARFGARSSRCWVLEYRARPAAVFGLAPDVWLGRRACVWLLTGKGVERIPKLFFRTARALLQRALGQYDELYNYADERYPAALRFVRRLGGRFDGTFYRTPCAKFLRFTFRRNS